MNFKLNYTLLTILLTFIFVMSAVVFSQDIFAQETVTINNPLGSGTDSINGLMKKILEGVIKIGMPIVALAIIYSGFLFVSAQGNTEKLDAAKKSLTFTIIGAALLLGAWALAQVISETVLKL